MAAPFSRTLGAVRADRGRYAPAAAGLGILILGSWAIWLFAGQIAVYRMSARARLEVSPAPAQVAAPVGGRLVEVHLIVGTRVVVGDVLVAIDTAAEHIALDRAKARLAAVEPELESLSRELVAEATAGRGGATSDQEAESEVIARRRAVEAALAQAEEDEKRTRAMVEGGATAAADLSRAIAETKQRRAARDAVIHEAGGRNADRQSREATRAVRREQLTRQRAELEATVATLRGEIEQLVHEIDRRTLRAPVDGVLGDVAALRPGAVLADGAVVATVVPEGKLQVVGEYGPETIGRLAAGQRARVRLDAFPWTHYGTLDARVARVGNEVHDNLIRVELVLEPSQTAIPIAHGMTGTVEIEVEHASPAELLLRAIGKGARS